MNCLAKSYESYDIEVPQKGIYTEILNTEDERYDGCGRVNAEPMHTWVNGKRKYAVTLKIAPFAAIWLRVSKEH